MITYPELVKIVNDKLVNKTDPRSYEELSEIIFGEGNSFNESEVRKRMYGIKRAIDIIEADQDKIAGAAFLEQLNATRDDIRRERIRLQTLNVERNRIDRVTERQRLYYEQVGAVCETLPLPEFQPLYDEDDTSSVEYVLTIADVHYGAVFTSENNQYNPEIAKERFQKLAGEMIDFIQEHHVRILRVISLGDLLQGILRINDLRLNDSTIVKATVEISRIMASFLNTLAAYCYIEYYHTPAANHTQLRSLGSKANELMDEDLEYLIGNYISDLCADNRRIAVLPIPENQGYVELDVNGFSIIALHGHQLKSISTALTDISVWKHKFYDYLLLGHFHSSQEITSNESTYHDTEILISPAFIGSDPYSDSLLKGNSPAVKIYGFDSEHGHTETHKIYL